MLDRKLFVCMLRPFLRSPNLIPQHRSLMSKADKDLWIEENVKTLLKKLKGLCVGPPLLLFDEQGLVHDSLSAAHQKGSVTTYSVAINTNGVVTSVTLTTGTTWATAELTQRRTKGLRA